MSYHLSMRCLTVSLLIISTWWEMGTGARGINWLCKFGGISDCDTTGLPVMMLLQKPPPWKACTQNPGDTMSFSDVSLVQCAAYAVTFKYIVIHYYSNRVCVIIGSDTTLDMFIETPNAEHWAKYTTITYTEEVGKNKLVTAKTIGATYLGPENSNDGDVDTVYAAAYSSSNWMLMSLGMSYPIHMIRISTRNNCCTEFFIGIVIKGGTSAVTDGDFSSYDNLGKVESELPSPLLWCHFFQPDATNYKYIGVNVENDIQGKNLDVSEIEVHSYE